MPKNNAKIDQLLYFLAGSASFGCITLTWRKSFPRPKVITVLKKILRIIQFST
ncbi:MAG: hypothetical protein AAGG80_01180 [Pseudomonadota bacterium]